MHFVADRPHQLKWLTATHYVNRGSKPASTGCGGFAVLNKKRLIEGNVKNNRTDINSWSTARNRVNIFFELQMKKIRSTDMGCGGGGQRKATIKAKRKKK